ncbi:MAG TPA: helical backbone metal receptor [Candidatus Eremiobacteraceae bacterium]|nr:helical backbone metal receptor [Candidatus Eremiobacteraceae bacterium]
MVALLLALTGCTAHPPQPASSTPRLISLAPSLTEIVYAVGCEKYLVGDTAYDNYPAAARQLPHVGDVRTADLERVAALRPTGVLALHDEEPEASPIEHRLNVPVVFLPNRDLRDLDADIAGIGKACGREKQAVALTRSLERRIATIRFRALKSSRKVRVLYLLGLPGYTAGPHSFLNDMIDAAGGVNVAASANEPYPNLNAEAIVKMDPDVIIVAGETPFDSGVRAQEPWRSLRAVQMGRVLRPPSDDIMERDGPRIVDGLEWLQRALLHVK